MKPISLLRAAGLATVMFGAIALGQASAAEVNTGYFGNVAIEGYDTVAYFTLGKATKGSDKFAHDWGGATWYFSTEANRDLFAANPEAYAPQFGGLCAEGVAFHEVTVQHRARGVRDRRRQALLHLRHGLRRSLREPAERRQELARGRTPSSSSSGVRVARLDGPFRI